MKHGPVLSAWRNAIEVTIKPSQANASSTWDTEGKTARESGGSMPIAAISLGKLEKDDDILTVFERLRVTRYSIPPPTFGGLTATDLSEG